MSVVKLYDIRWVSHTAGFSPIKTKFGPNVRTELFFMGCKKAISGNPCKECFNPKLWKDITGARELNPANMAEHIEKFAPNKYITIVGGEPFDQPEGLTDLCEELKKRDFHIIVFTHYTLKGTFKQWKKYSDYYFAFLKNRKMPDIIEGWTHDLFIRFLKNIDILVDGEYDKDKRIYDESLHDGFHDAVGSSNQIVWDLKEWRDNNFSTAIYGQLAENILQLGLREKDNSLVFITKHKSYRVFPLFLKESKNSGEKHTRWFVSSFNLRIPVEGDDFWLYYYLLRFKTDEKSEQESRNDIKRDIRRYCALKDIDDAVVESLCSNVDDHNFFLYNNLWLNEIARHYDNGHYEVKLDEIRKELLTDE